MQPRSFDGRATMRLGLVVGVAGIGIYIGGLLLGREQTMMSYLTAYAYALSLAIGALLFLTMTAAMGATWPLVVRRIAEGIVATFPLLALLVVPILFELKELYGWMHPWTIADEHTRISVSRQLAYLNRGFFVARQAVYFSVFVVTAELMRAWSLRQDVDPGFSSRRRIRVFGAAMFGPVLVAESFLSVDLVMSVSNGWYSGMFPLYFAAGGMLGAVSLMILLALVAQRRGGLPLNQSHYYALGRTLFTILLVWGYMQYFQLMIIWIADIPAEASWYVDRSGPGWYWMSMIVIFFLHLCVPFVLLFQYRTKRSAAGIAFVAAWLLVLHFFDVYWMIHPSLRKSHFEFNGMDVAMWLGVCGLCAAFGAWRMRGVATAAWRDPVFEKALHYRSI